jgi:hypothetical protein
MPFRDKWFMGVSNVVHTAAEAHRTWTSQKKRYFVHTHGSRLLVNIISENLLTWSNVLDASSLQDIGCVSRLKPLINHSPLA